MANWTDCTMRFFSDDEKVLKKIEKEAEEKDFAEYSVYFDYEEFSFSCSGRWNADYDWFKDICEKYQVAGKLIDAEPGCDFYVEIEVDEDGDINESHDSYLCDASIEEYGRDYFIEYYCDTFDTPEEAEYVLDKLKLTGEEREEAMRYIVNDPRYCVRPSAKLREKFDSLFKDAPKIGTTNENCNIYCQIDEFLIIEAEPRNANYIATVFNQETKQWQEKEFILGDIELAEKIIFNEDIGSSVLDEYGNKIA